MPIHLRGELKGFRTHKTSQIINPLKDPVDRKESVMSIGTQPEEEIMERQWMIKASE